jgi:hypothetical protein
MAKSVIEHRPIESCRYGSTFANRIRAIRERNVTTYPTGSNAEVVRPDLPETGSSVLRQRIRVNRARVFLVCLASQCGKEDTRNLRADFVQMVIITNYLTFITNC